MSKQPQTWTASDKSWLETARAGAASDAEKMRQEASSQDRLADRLEGATFVGEPPARGPRELARMLRRGADALDAQAKKS
jgi:hypothetical protein